MFLLFLTPPHILKNKLKQNKLIFPIKNFIKTIKPIISQLFTTQNKANKNDKLKLRRLALGLTQTKVAEAINVTFSDFFK